MKLFGRKKKKTTAPDKQGLQETKDSAVATGLANIDEALSLAEAVREEKNEAPASDPVKVEKQKQHDRSLYNSLLAGLYDAVLIVDSKGGVIGSNHRCDTFFGYEEGEIWGTNCSELIANINVRVLTKIQSYACEGRFTVVTTKCKRKDGSSFPAEIAISQINLLQEGDLIFSIRNNERREKAKGRKILEEKALQHTTVGIAVCNTDGLIEYANRAFSRLLMYEEEKDVFHHFIGDFCKSTDSANALVKTPSEHSSWFGELEIVTSKDIVRRVIATSTLAVKSNSNDSAQHLVVSLTALPEAAV